MKFNSLLSQSVLLLGLSAIFLIPARAQITWQEAQTITGNSNIISAATTTGATTFDAFLTNSGSNITPLSIDGVTFNRSNAVDPNALTQGDGFISYTVTSGANNHYGFPGTYSTTPPSSPEFAAIMESGGTYQDGGAGTGTITISGLTLGDVYAVQIFNYAADGDQGLTTFSSLGGNTVTISNLGSGQFATGTFTATGTTQSFDWAGAGSGFTVVGSINVANITAVPEPAVSGLVAAGLLFGLVVVRYRQKNASLS
jgi:hypothetical protein